MNKLARVADLPERCDLAIVGAGPAGLAAAAMAEGFGLDVVLLDENPEPGGQIYRAVGSASTELLSLLGGSYARGLDLLAALSETRVAYLPGATVWMASADME